MPWTTVARDLVRSCHPLPTLAVTALATVLAISTGADIARTVLLAVTVLAGQLSIGWSNDWLDAERDESHSRTDKPVATGALRVATVRQAAWTALAASVLLSLGLGIPAAAAAFLVVAGGWAYNLGLKATPWSAAAYAVAFGSLPAVVTLSSPGMPIPAAWAVLAGALLGVGAHLANVLPDLTDDEADGVRGLPHRLGATASAVIAPLLFVAAGAAVVLGPPGDVDVPGWVTLGTITLVGVVGSTFGASNPRSRWMFRALVIAALAVVVLFAGSGADLV